MTGLHASIYFMLYDTKVFACAGLVINDPAHLFDWCVSTQKSLRENRTETEKDNRTEKDNPTEERVVESRLC